MGAYKYAEVIGRLLNTCEYLEMRPTITSKIEIPADNPDALYWKEKIFFADEKVLSVLDSVTFDADGKMAERAFAYDFRNKGSSDPIFRICNHCRPLPAGDPCHVHVGDDENILECFPTSIDKDFTYAIRCIKNFYTGKTQDWEGGTSGEQGT